jgi:hypothetical protein
MFVFSWGLFLRELLLGVVEFLWLLELIGVDDLG